MRKLLFLMLGVVTLGFTSCQKDYHNYYTVSNKTIYAERANSQWQLSQDGKTYSTAIPFVETDNFYNEYDGILVYISYDGVIYEQIPETYRGVSYSFSTTNRELVVDMQYPDYTVVTTPPGRVYFKIVLIPSQE